MRKRGFTLLELLIVLVVIGILGITMMIAGEQIYDSARATEVINNLKMWRNAALAFYADNLEECSKSDFNFGAQGVRERVIKYLSVDDKYLKKLANDKNNIKYETFQSEDGTWYIWHNVGRGAGKVDLNNNIKTGLKAKLFERAKAEGLLDSSAYTGSNANKKVDANKFYQGGGYVAVKVR
ncbi:MAG: prepilin-type N-terminal cleavage/methylation domain-containing protein [Synergistaceae bacterium]|nr:prepilin-type N-terminal cleavage/methylation domain-containing protein [Synergistaceae bacterium]MBR0317589.1 prepilin-type N-terminal cleavage/methylation domain-containing protein [Synergistaceae bacterium]